MSPPSINISVPNLKTYTPLTPYLDSSGSPTLSNNLLCPRYAEDDTTSAPPSPASIESFDILDSVAWRQGHTSHNSRSRKARGCAALRAQWRKNSAKIVCILLLMLLLVAGCAVGGGLAWRHQGAKVRDECTKREGGGMCNDVAWAKCIATNGLGYCEGIMGKANGTTKN